VAPTECLCRPCLCLISRVWSNAVEKVNHSVLYQNWIHEILTNNFLLSAFISPTTNGPGNIQKSSENNGLWNHVCAVPLLDNRISTHNLQGKCEVHQLGKRAKVQKRASKTRMLTGARLVEDSAMSLCPGGRLGSCITQQPCPCDGLRSSLMNRHLRNPEAFCVPVWWESPEFGLWLSQVN
jgi:hypothetical protein